MKPELVGQEIKERNIRFKKYVTINEAAENSTNS